MSRKRMPGLGKSGTLRMAARSRSGGSDPWASSRCDHRAGPMAGARIAQARSQRTGAPSRKADEEEVVGATGFEPATP